VKLSALLGGLVVMMVLATPQQLRAEPFSDCRAGAPTPSPLPVRPTYGDFWRALGAQIDALDGSALEPELAAFGARNGIDPDAPGLRQEFRRLWTAFEATRDGGWWRLRWQITDQEPTSLQIWKAWRRSPPRLGFGEVSAVAECDEITALFAITARRLDVRGVGLFYPTWNHVIAGWMPSALAGAKRVVLVPTTQIFQSCESTFDQTSFRVPKQVYEFPRYDVRDASELPAELATFLLDQVRAYGEATPALLSLIRNKRAELMRSSLVDCGSYRQQLVEQLRRAPLSCGDRRALRQVALELGSTAKPDELLSLLASP
jgi:hypothetical protein